MRLHIPISVVLLNLLAIGCHQSNPTAPPTEFPADPGVTTPSDIPFGDYPPIPRPSSFGDVGRTKSDSYTTIEPLATDFRPAVLALTGNWSVGRGAVGATNTAIISCTYEVFSGFASSTDILFPTRKQACPFPEGLGWEYVTYPDHGRAINVWLASLYDQEGAAASAPPSVNAHRPYLVKDGALEPGTFWELPLITYGKYTGDQALGALSDPRSGCELDGAVGPNALPCDWSPFVLASVQQATLTNPVYLRRDVFWEKAGDSHVYSNAQAFQVSQSFERSWTVGTEDTQTTEFGRSVTASLGVDAKGIKAAVDGTLSETFGSSVTVSSTETRTETLNVTVAGSTNAVFEIWTLTEEYAFANADGTPYEDPNYVFAISDLTRRGTIARAFVSTEFPN